MEFQSTLIDPGGERRSIAVVPGRLRSPQSCAVLFVVSGKHIKPLTPSTIFDFHSEMPNQRRLRRTPSLRARVPRSVLEGGANGPFRRGFLSRMVRRIAPVPPVKVERWENGLAPARLYAPFVADNDVPYAETELLFGSPSSNNDNLVYNDMPYEVRVVGMMVKSYDRFDNTNELILYSTESCNSHQQSTSLPFIHYDYSRDATAATEKANKYIPVPASKSFVTGSSGKKNSGSGATASTTASEPKSDDTSSVISLERVKQMKRQRNSVNLQFRILEIDEPNETVQEAVNGIRDLGGMMSAFGTALPFLGALNPAMAIASSLTQRALDSYAKPDSVLNIDMDLNIASRERVAMGTAPPGEYLRYGYYFFLEEPVEGKLYASVRTPGNLTLMLKRSDDAVDENSHAGARAYFPLTEVSYLVVSVREPIELKRTNRRPILMNHAHRLEDLFKSAQPGMDKPASIQKSLYNLGCELGVFDSDSDHELDSCNC